MSLIESYDSGTFKPAISLKFLRDKQSSCNILFMAKV